jgi:hypothetical protein
MPTADQLRNEYVFNKVRIKECQGFAKDEARDLEERNFSILKELDVIKNEEIL